MSGKKRNKLKSYLEEDICEKAIKNICNFLPENCKVLITDRDKFFYGEQPDYEEKLISELYIGDEKIGEIIISDYGKVSQDAINFLSFFFQEFINRKNVNKSLANETLEVYRELAMVQRCVLEFNKTLDPKKVADTFLKEFVGRGKKSVAGAVYDIGSASSEMKVLRVFGQFPESFFEKFSKDPIFSKVVKEKNIYINNDLSQVSINGECTKDIQSILAAPLMSFQGVCGIIVLLSKNKDSYTSFDSKRANTLGYIAGSALRNAMLYKEQKTLFNGLINSIAAAIDSKSSHTAGHCKRVPWLARKLAEAINRNNEGPFSETIFTEEELEEIDIAAKLHDCGKISTPEWIMDKRYKLEGIYNRLEVIALRLEMLKFNKNNILTQISNSDIDDDLTFLSKCNSGEIVIDEHAAERINNIAKYKFYTNDGKETPLLDEDDINRLTIKFGNLSHEERVKISDHVVQTIKILENIPFPPELSRVVEIAGHHHERNDGSGYPYGLKKDQLSVQTRILAIADVFEAITAPDRPYRTPANEGKALAILSDMGEKGQLDKDLIHIFYRDNIAKKYFEYLYSE